MRAMILFISSSVFLFCAVMYQNMYISQSGEYHASLHVINNNDVVKMRIVSHVENNDFVTHTYLTSPGLSSTATFLSKGSFIDREGNGKLTYLYSMSLIESTEIVNPEEARIYMDLVARLGLPIEESIDILYHNNEITVFDMMRNNSVIMYEKE
ncbi:MAG: hypothetical protein ACRCVV_09035 [Shewanella sp.]